MLINRWLVPLCALSLLGCETPTPLATGVDPGAGIPGAELTIKGEHFEAGTTATMAGQPLDGLQVIDAQTLRGKVPDNMPAGTVDLVVRSAGGQSTSLAKAFVVESAAPPEHPCRSSEKRFTAIPPDGSVVKIDRHLADGKVERSSFKTHKIAAVELRTIALPDDTPAAEGEPVPVCSTIWLVLEGEPAQHVLFDADDKTELTRQAQKIAQGLGKRLRMAEGMPQ